MTDTMILKIEPMLIGYDEARAALDEVEAEWGFKLDNWQATLVIKAVRRGFSNPFCRHVVAAPTGTGKTEIGIAIIKLYDKLLRQKTHIPHCAHAWLSERQILRNESQVRIERTGLFTSNTIDAKGVGSRMLVSGMVNMIAPQTFVMRGNPNQIFERDGVRFKKHERPMAYEKGYVQWFGVFIADEGHHGAADYYGSCVRSWPGPVFALTATPWLLSDFKSLGQGMCSDGQECGPYETIDWAPEGHELVGRYDEPEKRLSDINIIRVAHEVRIRHEYLKKAVGNADGYDGESVDVEVNRLLAIGRPIVTELERHAKGRPCMIFNRTKEAAFATATLIRSCGHTADTVVAETPEDDRRRLLDELQEGKLDFLTSVDVFGEGVNIPNVNCVAMIRPTDSITRHRQFLGRGLRKRADNSPLTVIDFADNCNHLGSPLDGWGQDLSRGHFKRMGLEARRTKDGKPRKLFDTRCPNTDCGESCNWNEEFCQFCNEPLSWVCRGDTVELTDGTMLEVAGHHTREWNGRFNLDKSRVVCADAIDEAIAYYQQQQREARRIENQERRERQAEENRIAAEQREVEREERRKLEAEQVKQEGEKRRVERRNNWKWRDSRGLHGRTQVIVDKEGLVPYELMLTPDATHLIATRGVDEPVVRKCEGESVADREQWAKDFMLTLDPELHGDIDPPRGKPHRLNDGWGLILEDNEIKVSVGDQIEAIAVANSGTEYQGLYECIYFKNDQPVFRQVRRY